MTLDALGGAGLGFHALLQFLARSRSVRFVTEPEVTGRSRAHGFNMFKLSDRKSVSDYTLEEIREGLPQAITQIQFREKYDTWVKGVRTKAHIEIRKS